jgi:hypothetical protein
MNFTGVELQGLVFLGLTIAIAFIVAFGLIRFLRGIWNWVFPARSPDRADRAKAEPIGRLIAVGDPKLTATHILAIKSNLDAVSRQLADLESRLRSQPSSSVSTAPSSFSQDRATPRS